MRVLLVLLLLGVLMADDDVTTAFDYLGKRQPLSPPKLALTSSTGGGGPVTAPVTPLASPSPTIGTSSPSVSPASGGTSRVGSTGGSNALAQAQQLTGLARQGLRFVPQTGVIEPGGSELLTSTGDPSQAGVDTAVREGTAPGVGLPENLGGSFGPGGSELLTPGGGISGAGLDTAAREGLAPGVEGSGLFEGSGIGGINPINAGFALANFAQLLGSNAEDSRKAYEALKLVASLASGPFSPIVGGFFDAIASGLFHEGGYIPHRLQAADDIKNLVPGIFENIEMATTPESLRQAIELSPLATNPDYRIRLSEGTPGDPLSAMFSGGYEFGDQTWATVNPKLHELLRNQSDLIARAQAGDPQAQATLQQITQSARAAQTARQPENSPAGKAQAAYEEQERLYPGGGP